MIAALNPQADVARKAAPFSLVIEPGHEEMWFAMRDFRGPFSAVDVALATGCKESTATRYIRHLVNNGIAEEAGLSTDRKVLFRVRKLGATPEVFDAKGDTSSDYHLRHALWLATRRLKHGVTEGRLLDLAGQHVELTQRQVRAWITRLVAADYLTEMFHKAKSGETEYQLRQLRDTGPLPPRFCEAQLLYDVNLAVRGHRDSAFFGVGRAKEVKL